MGEEWLEYVVDLTRKLNQLKRSSVFADGRAEVAPGEGTKQGCMKLWQVSLIHSQSCTSYQQHKYRFRSIKYYFIVSFDIVLLL